MVRWHSPASVLRNTALVLAPLLIGAAVMNTPASAQPQASAPTTTGVMVILTARPETTREQVMAMMPAEIRETVQLYLRGKIREWYGRGDGRGVVLLLATASVEEARSLMDALPLGQRNLMDHEYIPVGPLFPLGLLLRAP